MIATVAKQKFNPTTTSIFIKHFSWDQQLASLLASCNQITQLTQIHGWMIKTGLDLIPFPLSKLLASSSFINLQYASSIFRYIHNPNLFMFNTMLRTYSVSDCPNEALVLFNHMRTTDMLLDEFSFVSTVKSCARLFAITNGSAVHSLGVRSGCDLFLNVRNTLLQLYCTCGRIDAAHQLFEEMSQERDLVSWNTLMGGYLRVSQPAVVLDIFKQLCGDGMRIGATTMLSVLSAISECGNNVKRESLHGYCIKKGFCADQNVVTALVAMYGRTGMMESGRRIFDEVDVKDVVLWNCLMDGYAKHGLIEESLSLLRLMKIDNVRPNSSTLAGLLSACATNGALAVGQCIHNYIEQQQLVLDAVLGTALLDMYCKCGLLKKAIDVFNNMVSKDVKSWSAMILGYGMHGEAKDAIAIFYQMAEEVFRHNEVTFLAILSAFSHRGLVTEGIRFFTMMVQEYGLTPRVEHYGCMIDLFGRAGLLDEAHYLVKSLPIQDDATAWRALLAACRVYGNVDLGERVKKALEENYDLHPADSIVLSSTYAAAGSMPGLKTTQAVRGKVIENYEYASHRVKEAGCSSIELDDKSWLTYEDNRKK